MATRKVTRATVPASWHISEVARVNGRVLAPGRVLRISRERGTFAFLRHVRNVDTGAEWLDVREVATGALRAFRVDRVRTVTRRTVPTVPVAGRSLAVSA